MLYSDGEYAMKLLDSGTAELAREIIYDYLRKAAREAAVNAAEDYFSQGRIFPEWKDTWSEAVGNIATELMNHASAFTFMAENAGLREQSPGKFNNLLYEDIQYLLQEGILN
jgi:hypothetical protein